MSGGNAMIKTGLPYNMSEMEEIKNNGAIVDMSDIKFPGIPKDKIQRTAFIFFRNTGFNVKLDFSKCTFEEKEAFLIAYLTENLDVKPSEFATSYIKIFNRLIGNDINIECILLDEEIDQFIKNHEELLSKLFQFINSLPVFALFYFSLNDKAYTLSDIERSDENIINDNFYYIISRDEFISIFDNDAGVAPLFYTQLFTFENTKLLQAVQSLPFFSILHGLSTLDSATWEEMIDASESFK